MVTLITWCYRIPASFVPLQQPRRFRYIPSPGTLDQRLFREVTKPIFRKPTLSRQEKYVLLKEEYEKSIQQNPYRHFLVRKAKTDFYDQAEGRMLLVFHQLYAYPWEKQPVINKLFESGLKFRSFPMAILKEAAKNTKWQRFADIVLKEPIPNLYLFGDASPRLCETALSITNRTKFFILLGGVIEHRIMTRDEVKYYASLGELSTLHAELLGTLQQPIIETVQLLNHHGKELANLLQWHAKSSTESAHFGEGNSVERGMSSEVNESLLINSSSDPNSSDSESDSDPKYT